jgi:protein-disulfide isomerase
VTDEFIEGIAEGAGVPDMKQFNEERKSGKFTKKVEATTEQATKFGFTGTPSFAVEGPSSNGLELVGTPESTGQLEEAIEKAS